MNIKEKLIANKKGFTLTEIMLVLGVSAILICVSVVGITQHQRNSEQTELDAIAKEVFVAAQNHLTEATTQNYLGRTSFGEEEADNKGIFYYAINNQNYSLLDEKNAINLMLPDGSVDDSIRLNGSYIIRYDKNSAQVLDVFFARETGKYAYSFENSKYTEIMGLADTEDEQHKSERHSYGENKAVIGYYGGAKASNELFSGAQIEPPELQIVNSDKLTAVVKNPNSSNKNIELKLIITGETSGNKKEIKLADVDRSGEIEDAWNKADIITVDKINDICKYKYSVNLDNITNKDTSFYKLFCSGSKDNLIPGENIMVEAVAYDNSTYTNIAESGEKLTNSLFADLDTSSKTAEISSIRHIENLSKDISGFDNDKIKVTDAVQTTDLSWDSFKVKTVGSGKPVKIYSKTGIYSTAENSYSPVRFENKTGDISTIKYDGQNHTISGIEVNQAKNAGLFEELGGKSEIENLRLSDFNIQSSGGDAGTLAGQLTGDEIKIDSVLAVSDKGTSYAVTSNADGKAAGGLVGSVSSKKVEINNSGASVPVGASSTVGGIVGSQINDSKLTISNSFSGGHTKYGTAKYNGTINLVSTNGAVGGIIGEVSSGTLEITQTFNTSSVSTKDGAPAGGIIGHTAVKAKIDKAYSIGYVDKVKTDSDNGIGNTKAGAFIGVADNGIDNSDTYYMPEVYEGINPLEGNNLNIAYLGTGTMNESVKMILYSGNITYVGTGTNEYERILSNIDSRNKASSEGSPGSVVYYDSKLASEEYPFKVWTSMEFDKVNNENAEFYGDWQPVKKYQTKQISFWYSDPTDNGSIKPVAGSFSQSLNIFRSNNILTPDVNCDGYAVDYWKVDGSDKTITPADGGWISFTKAESNDDIKLVAYMKKVDSNSCNVAYYVDKSGKNTSFELVETVAVAKNTPMYKIKKANYIINDNYTFEGWYYDQALTQPVDFDSKTGTIAGNLDVYGKYKKVDFYTVTVDFLYQFDGGSSEQLNNIDTYSLSGDGIKSQYQMTVPVGKTFSKDIELPDAKKAGYDYLNITVGNYDSSSTGTIQLLNNEKYVHVEATEDARYQVIYHCKDSNSNSNSNYTYKVICRMYGTDSSKSTGKNNLIYSENANSYYDCDWYGKIFQAKKWNVPDIKILEIPGWTCKTTSVSLSNGDNRVDKYIYLEYERNKYAINYNTDGGSIIDEDSKGIDNHIKVMYFGEPLSDAKPSSNPEKKGYTVNKSEGADGWSIFKRGDTPSNSFTWNDTMPAYDITAKVNWTEANTTYRVAFWYENADDNNFSYVDSMEVTAKTGATVSSSMFKTSVDSYSGIGDKLTEVSYASNYTLYYRFSDVKITPKSNKKKGTWKYIGIALNCSTVTVTGECERSKKNSLDWEDEDNNISFNTDNNGDSFYFDKQINVCFDDRNINVETKWACLSNPFINISGSVYYNGQKWIDRTTNRELTYTYSSAIVLNDSSNNIAVFYDKTNNPKEAYVYSTYLLNSSSIYGKCVYIDGCWYTYTGDKNAGEYLEANYPFGKLNFSHDNQHFSFLNLACVQDLRSSITNLDAIEGSAIKNKSGNDLVEAVMEKTVKGDGSTVLNVYFTRNLYTLTFNDESLNLLSKIEKKYMAKIDDSFPYTEGEVKYWSPAGSTVYTNRVLFMAYMPDENIVFTRCAGNNKRNIRHKYYKEDANSGNYSVNYNYRNYCTNNSGLMQTYIYYFEDFMNIRGFSKSIVRVKDDGLQLSLSSSEKYNDVFEASSPIGFYYTPKSYNVDYYINGEDYTDEINNMLNDESYTISEIKKLINQIPGASDLLNEIENYLPRTSYKYGQTLRFNDTITSALLQFSTGQFSILEPGNKFDGWYSDPECTQKYNINNTTMPDNNIVLYAKWVEPTYKVSFYKNETDTVPVKTMYVTKNTTIDEKDIPVVTMDNKEFAGWYYKERYSIFSNYNKKTFYPDQLINPYFSLIDSFINIITGTGNEMKIYAEWNNVEPKADVTVKYLEKDTNNVLAESIVEKDQKIGKRISLVSKVIDRYTPDNAIKDYTVKSGDNEVIFYYSKNTGWKYNINYHIVLSNYYESDADVSSFTLGKKKIQIKKNNTETYKVSTEEKTAYNEIETFKIEIPDNLQEYKLKEYEINGVTSDNCYDNFVTIKQGTTDVDVYIEPKVMSFVSTDAASKLYDGNSATDSNMSKRVVYNENNDKEVILETWNVYKYYSMDDDELDTENVIDAGLYKMRGFVIFKAIENNGNKETYFLNYKDADCNNVYTIERRNVVLTSGSESQNKGLFDNTVTNDKIDVSGDGFAENEGAVCAFSVEAFRKTPGKSENAFTYKLQPNTKAQNYDITTVFGTLTVKK